MHLPQAIWTDDNISGPRSNLMHVYNWSFRKMCSIQCLSDCCRTFESNTQQEILVCVYTVYCKLYTCLTLYVSLADCLSLDLPVCLHVYMPVRLSVCLSFSRPACLSVVCSYAHFSVCISTWPSLCHSLDLPVSVCLFIYPFLCLSVFLSTRLSLCLSLDLSVCLSVCLSFYPPVCLFICLSVRRSVCLT